MSMEFVYDEFGVWLTFGCRPDAEDVAGAVRLLYAEIPKMFSEPFIVKELNVFVKPLDSDRVCDPIKKQPEHHIGDWSIALKAGILHKDGDGTSFRLVEGVTPKPL